MASAWKLRARCPKGFGVAAGQVLTLTLPKGAESSLSELRDEAATHAKVARDRLCLKSGFPPKVILQTPPGPDEGSVTLGETVLQNRDVVMLERSEAAGAAEVLGRQGSCSQGRCSSQGGGKGEGRKGRQGNRRG